MIKFLIRECGKGVLEKVVTGTDLIQLLEEKDWLSAENVDKLSDLLRLARRNDCVKRYKSMWNQQSQEICLTMVRFNNIRVLRYGYFY